MLVITRRAGESILLGDEIRIVILGVESDRIKIGIEAPQSTKILRAELMTEVSDINREATQSDLSLIQGIHNLRPAAQRSVDQKKFALDPEGQEHVLK